MRWAELKPLPPVDFYTGDGWKKGIVRTVAATSVTVAWKQGSDTKITRIYDTRNIKPQ